jgi:hypothetical protein
MVAGFTDGILLKSPIVKIIKTVPISIQTDPIEPIIIIKEIIKEVIKEVPKEIIKEVIKIVEVEKIVEVAKKPIQVKINKNKPNISDVFHKDDRTSSKNKQDTSNVFLEDVENDEKNLIDAKINKQLEDVKNAGKKLKIKIIPKR